MNPDLVLILDTLQLLVVSCWLLVMYCNCQMIY